MTDELTAAQIGAKAEEAFSELKSLTDELKTAIEAGDQKDRVDALSAKADELGANVATLMADKAAAEEKEAQEGRLDRLQQQIDDIAKSQHAPSKASLILGGGGEPAADADTFFRNLVIATNPKAPLKARQLAEEALEAMGSVYQSADPSKAVLGTTDATGGYMVPTVIAEEVSQIKVANNPYRSLLTVVPNTLGPTIQLPAVGLAPTRAVVIGRGDTKTNAGIAFGNYTVTMFTLAVIIDAANQWLSQTRGRGEQLIRRRLGEAIALGESYYILQGAGTTEPKGIITSIGGSGQFVTAHTAASTTVVGSVPTAIANAAGALADRSRVPDGVVMNAGDFWRTLAYGSDTAGFWVAPAAGPANVNAAGFQNGQPALRYWSQNLGIYPDANMPANNLIVGEWKSAELYVGDDFRVDTSTEAGDRWDKNLTGFRAEEEIGFNADPYVAAGMFQRVLDVVA